LRGIEPDVTVVCRNHRGRLRRGISPGTELVLRPVGLSGRGPEVSRASEQGLTLIEMALVLLVMGLMLVGMVKGQELIQNSRVHSAIAEHDGFKAAVFAFHDRFRQLPGDYADATTNIQLTATAESTRLPR
jgi:hypothetical protein